MPDPERLGQWYYMGFRIHIILHDAQGQVIFAFGPIILVYDAIQCQMKAL